jgi:hypothetical protein
MVYQFGAMMYLGMSGHEVLHSVSNVQYIALYSSALALQLFKDVIHLVAVNNYYIRVDLLLFTQVYNLLSALHTTNERACNGIPVHEECHLRDLVRSLH